MQPEDSQIDALLKRYGREAGSGAPAEHLDADELNAFAEGAAPASARSRYVSHLAECYDCRQLATQLSIAAGATVIAGAGAIETADGSHSRADCADLRQSTGRNFSAAVESKRRCEERRIKDFGQHDRTSETRES